MPPRRPDLSFGQFAFDPNSRLLRREGVEVPLPPRVLAILEVLLTRAGDVVPRQELIETVWKDAFVTDTSLAEAISFLRQALGDDPQAPTYIQTVHRRGYRFVAPITVVEPAAPTVADPGHDPTLVPPPTYSYDIVAWAFAILAIIGAGSAMWYANRQRPVLPPIVQLTFDAGEGLTFDERARAVAISPDATTLVWSACRAQACDLYMRPVASVYPQQLPGTAGAAAPFFSPDGRWVGFFADGKLKKVGLQGGPPTIITDAPYIGGATWMPDGHIVFAASVGGGLRRISESGGEIERLTDPSVADGEIRHVDPQVTARGDAIVFLAVTSATEAVVPVGRLVLLPYRTSAWLTDRRILIEDVRAGAVVGNEFIVYTRGIEMSAQALASGQVPAAEAFVAGVVRSPHISVSANGSVVYVQVPPLDRKAIRRSWNRGTTNATLMTLPAAGVVIAPDGKRVARLMTDELWITDLTRDTTIRLAHSGTPAAPTWSPDGATVFYAAKREGRFEMFARDATANGEERRILAVPDRHLFPASATSTRLAYVETGGTTGADVGVIDLAGSTRRLVAHTDFDETAPALSPDGRRLAYETNESGQTEVVLLDLENGRRAPISSGGGTRPLWAASGRALFFGGRGVVMRAEIAEDGELTGPPTLIHTAGRSWLAGVGTDGRVLLEHPFIPASTTAVVTVEWIRALRQIVAPPPVVLPR